MSMEIEFDSMEECAAQLRSKQEDVVSTLTEMNEMVRTLTEGGFVTDNASGALAEATDEFIQNNQTNIENVESFATWLEEASQKLQGTDNELAGSVSA